MDDLTALTTRRSAILTEIAALVPANSGGRPNVNGGGAGTVDHVGYKDGLYRELDNINKQIDIMSGPWEVPMEGRPS